MRYKPWHTKDLVRVFKERQSQKFDVNVMVTGARGNGKSNNALKCALRLPGFNMREDIVFSREDAIKKLAEKEAGTIVMDEFINVGYVRQFYEKKQQQFIQMLNMYRDKRNILFMCVPNFGTVDKQILGLCKFRLDVIKRGWAILHTPNPSSYSPDPWDIKYNEKIEKSWLERGIKKPDYRRLTTFRAVVKITELTEAQRLLYEGIKKERRQHLYEKDIKGEASEGSKYQHLYNEVITGDVDKERLEWYCKMNNYKISAVVTNLNKLLRDEGKPTLKHFLNRLKETNPIITNHIKNKNVV